MPRSITDTLPLTNSLKIPQLGFGVYQSPTDVCVESCNTALDVGYRHIDTAQYYGNEGEVGQAVKNHAVDRKDVYLSTKILSAQGSVDDSYQACVDSVNKLDPDTGYVDLFLIHSPNGGKASRKEMWQALERLYDEGKAKSIGVSNFGIKHIDELKEFAKVWPPHVNQIEVFPHPILSCSQQLLTYTSFTLGFNSEKSSTTPTTTPSLSKPTAPWCATKRPTTRLWPASPRSTPSLPTRSSSGTVSRRAGFLFPRATRLSVSRRMQMFMALISTMRISRLWMI